MKISIHELAHSKGVPAAVTLAMLAMQERISELEAAIAQQAPPAKIYPAAWRINYTINGASRSVLCGHNSIGDYRDMDPMASSTPLYTTQPEKNQT